MASRRIVFALAAVLLGAYYLWSVQATGHPFKWGRELDGYYDYLGRAFAQGHLDLPIRPAPELLALSNPYDPEEDSTYKLWDAVLFQRRYYLYHGAGPAVILFAPWRLITRHDLPENFALFLFCFGGWLLAAATLLRILQLTAARVGPAMLTVMLLALGICQSVPFLLNRIWVYELAIGGGYFCICAAFFFLARSIESKKPTYWLAGSGLMFGLAVACRPTLILASVIVFGGLALARKWRELASFTVPLAAAGAAIAFYNYARFGNPLEFGLRYLLSGPNQNRLKLQSANLFPGLYYNLFCQPAFEAVFPWVRSVLRYPHGTASQLPPEYFLEATIGAFFLAPFIAGAIFVPRTKLTAVRNLLWTLTASAAAILVFLAATGFVTQRYEVDFLPLLVLAALANATVWLNRGTPWRRVALGTALAASIAFGAVINMALGLTGPYDDVLKNRPASYARLAGWFSPVPEFRPMLNPSLDVKFSARVDRIPEGVRAPLLTIGRGPYSQFVYAERQGAQLHVVMNAGDQSVACEVPVLDARPLEFEVKYIRNSGKLTLVIDGKDTLAADAGIVFTSPSQVTVGENRIDPGAVAARFPGPIKLLEKTLD